MNIALRQQITKALESLPGDVRIAGVTQAASSSFASTAKLKLESGELLFVKHAAHLPPGVFECEHEALQLLQSEHGLQVPEPLCSGKQFIVTRWIDFGSKGADWQEAFGHGLALLHKSRQSDRYGFSRDNYLGASSQKNSWRDNWSEFWRENRLSAQLMMWRKHASRGDRLLILGEKLLNRLDTYLDAVREPGVLLHGDLWSGNSGADLSGKPVMFDPASYYGHREAEFGMMRLFGGFGPRVEAAYQEVWPFEPASEDRIALYRLYHELNHLNLFGASYYAQCLSTVESLL